MEIWEIKNSNWKREFDYELGAKVFFYITTSKFIIHLTGGSLIAFDKNEKLIKKFKGHNYLYTGDVNPQETEVFALENGKHFYIYSLEDFSLKHKVTLPRSYESIDLYGEFSRDGEFLCVPVMKYVVNEYKYWLCKYETKNYSLISMEPIDVAHVTRWPSAI